MTVLPRLLNIPQGRAVSCFKHQKVRLADNAWTFRGPEDEADFGGLSKHEDEKCILCRRWINMILDNCWRDIRNTDSHTTFYFSL